MSARERVTVFAATGFTGRLVCRALATRGVPFAVAGRSAERLARVADETGASEIVVADADAPATLGALSRNGTRVLVSCAGPFMRHGWPVAEAAVAGGVHYLDTTGEQPFIRAVAEGLDGSAAAAGCTLVSAMAMEYAVGDWTAAVAMGRAGTSHLHEVTVAYSFTAGHVSRGTALSILAMVGQRGWSWEEGRFRRRSPGSMRRRVAFPFGGRSCAWMPFGEPVFLARRGTVDTALSLMRMPKPTALGLRWTGLAGGAARRLLATVARPVLPADHSGPSEAERRASRFTLVADADGFRAVATGVDPYGLTAEIVSLGAEHLLGGGAPTGVRTPATIGLEPARCLADVGVILE